MKLDKPTSNTHSWARYAGLAGQMLASLALAIWLGSWLDGKTDLAFPIFALSLPHAGIGWVVLAADKRNYTPQQKK